MTNLHDELTRIADTAPPLHIADDVWERGRRARTRDRVVRAATAVAAVVAVIALLVGGNWLRPNATVPPADDGPGVPAVPSRIWPVPEHLLESTDEGFGRSWVAEVAETDLALGPASLVLGVGLDAEGPVVVTAADGSYHPVSLPGYAGADVVFMDDEANGIALSADGTHLAYTWAESAERTDYSRVPSGIRIVDLISGEITDVDLAAVTGDAQATLAGRLVWSPDGRWLAWSGRRYAQYNASGSSSGAGAGVAGLVRFGSTRSRPLPPDFSNFALAVTDDGTVFGSRPDLDGYVLWRDGQVRPLAGQRPSRSSQWGRGAASPDGRHVALPLSRPGHALPVVDLRNGRVLNLPLPADLGRVIAQPLGWAGEDRLAVQVTPVTDERVGGWSEGVPAVVVLPGPGVPDGPARVVTRWVPDRETALPDVSVAVDLVAARAPREFARPTWPASDETVAVRIATAVAAGCLLVAAGYFVRRRRRRS